MDAKLTQALTKFNNLTEAMTPTEEHIGRTP